MMKLYYAPETIALVSLIVVEELGAPCEPIRLDFAAAEQRGADYRSVNPKGRVPALVTDSGILTETPAILTYLATKHPEAGLMPEAAFAAARVHELMAYLCSTVHVSHAHMRRGARWSDDEAVIAQLKEKVPRNMADHFAYLEDRFKGPWALGADYTVGDPYLYVIASWLGRDGVDIAGFPKIAAHQRRMGERPAVQRALALQSARGSVG